MKDQTEAIKTLRALAKRVGKPQRELIALTADMLDTGGSDNIMEAARFAWFNNKSGLAEDAPIVKEFYIYMAGFSAGWNREGRP